MRLEESKQISDIRPVVFRKNKPKKNFEKFWKIKIKILTFAPRFAWNDWEEFFEKITYTTVVQVFRMNTVNNTWTWRKDGILSKDINNFNNEEFDPGSGWTLATGLTHASRGASGSSNTPPATGARVSNAYATYLSEENSSSKDELMLHETGVPHGNIC